QGVPKQTPHPGARALYYTNLNKTGARGLGTCQSQRRKPAPASAQCEESSALASRACVFDFLQTSVKPPGVGRRLTRSRRTPRTPGAAAATATGSPSAASASGAGSDLTAKADP